MAAILGFERPSPQTFARFELEKLALHRRTKMAPYLCGVFRHIVAVKKKSVSIRGSLVVWNGGIPIECPKQVFRFFRSPFRFNRNPAYEYVCEGDCSGFGIPVFISLEMYLKVLLGKYDGR